MLLTTFISSFFRSFIEIFLIVTYNPWYLIKIIFIWFFVSMAATYSYFLWTHQESINQIRADLALRLCKSMWLGLLTAIALIGLYEFILQMMCTSKIFMTSINTICHLSLTTYSIKYLYKIIGSITILSSSLWACYTIDPLLEQSHRKEIVDGYGWLIIIISLICFSFLWCIT